MKKSYASKLLILNLFVLSLSNVQATTPIAEVIKMRGEATQLVPGERVARKISMGDKFVEDASIVTGPKSFLKILFTDKTEINVGPESKIIISEMKTQSPGVISLLKGRIRTEVEKDSAKNENKFFIKTRTAAMGVRGTEFQTIYNPENKLTSLLTYKGEVAMVKIDEKTYNQLEEAPKKEIIRDDVTKLPEIKDGPVVSVDEVKQLNKLLKAKDTVLVPSGQNSFSTDELKKTSLPVKISPVQLEALYKNDEFKEKAVENLKLLSDSENSNATSSLKVAKQSAPAEGFFNAKTGDFAPKSGGFIDQKTGLYVPPSPDSKLDEKSGVFVAQKSGMIDADTGQYAAPKGLILDAKKGFILDKDQEQKPELVAMKQDLNKIISKDVVVGGDKSEEKIEIYNINEKFVRNRISIYTSRGDEKLTLNNNEANKPFVEYSGQYLQRFGVDWMESSLNRFSTLLSFEYSLVKYNANTVFPRTDTSNKLFSFSIGEAYALSRAFTVYTKIGLIQKNYLEQVTSTYPQSFELKRLVLTKVGLGLIGEFFSTNTFSIDALAEINFSFRKHYNNLIAESGSSLRLSIAPKYKIKDHQWVSLGINVENEKIKLNSLDSNSQERDAGGIELKYILDI